LAVDVYVPWTRRQKSFRGIQAKLAHAAVAVFRLTAPFVRRFPGLIFICAVVGACLLTWAVALSFRAVWRIEDSLIESGVMAPGATMTWEQFAAGARAAGTTPPLWLLAPLRWLVVRDVIALTGIIAFVSVLAMFAIWWERKVAGFIQSRLGPMRVGGWHGWSQSLADGLKLIGKEDLIPTRADRPLFRLAPYLSFVPALAAFFALPFGAYWAFRNLDIALLFILAMLGIEVMGVLIAGWASNNKWSMFGALREAAQVVSYEIPMGFSLLVPVMVAGTLQMSGAGSISERQAGGWGSWLAWHNPFTFIAMCTYFIASLAACKRAPFDLPEAESELVAGFHTEYSGFRWSLFFFAEYAAMFVVSGILVCLFLGAWDAPWAGGEAWFGAMLGWPWLAGLRDSDTLAGQIAAGILITGPIWFILKCMFLVYVQMWLRWTLPRLRIDQVLYSCVQVMLPLTMVVLLGGVLWELASDRSSAFAAAASVVRGALAGIGAVGALGMIWVAGGGFRMRRLLVGPLGVERPLPSG
jgi:NADH-quinone oxidoreductase subunit H